MESVETLLTFLLLAGLSPFFYVAWSRSRTWTAAIEEVARRRGASLVPEERGSGWIGLELTEDGIHLRVLKDRGEFTTAFVTWRARPLPPGTIEFEIQPLTRHITARFQDDFAIEGDRRTLARIWGPSEARLMLRFFASGRLSGHRDRIELRQRVGRVSPEWVEAGLDLVLRLARSDPFGLRELRELAGARDSTGGDLPGVVIDGPFPISIGPVQLEGRTVTEARAELSTTVEPGELAVEADRPLRGPALHDLPAHAVEQLGRIGSAHVDWTRREAVIRWHEIEGDRRRLESAIEFLRILGRPPARGVFR